MGRAPRPRWVRRDGRLVRIDGAEETHIVEERQRHPANRMEAHGDQEAADAGNAAKSLPPPPLPQSPPLRLLPWEVPVQHPLPSIPGPGSNRLGVPVHRRRGSRLRE
ncbi:hypothetical protein SeMB42_g02891 [Synchytrium endobioticum]|uniref:Uncharacterized protein n=1 Tax=Synchytrium endobioticum TaxID=286115 RepID=A0A507DB53_9FUNG|nr:hypothetical protein SeMB42_g02891 [Synchytrium endobioticum]